MVPATVLEIFKKMEYRKSLLLVPVLFRNTLTRSMQNSYTLKISPLQVWNKDNIRFVCTSLLNDLDLHVNQRSLKIEMYQFEGGYISKKYFQYCLIFIKRNKVTVPQLVFTKHLSWQKHHLLFFWEGYDLYKPSEI